MIKGSLLIIALLLCSIAEGQTKYKYLYDEYLSEALVHHRDLADTIDVTIDRLGRTNPELIYLYLNYLDKFYNKNISDNNTSGWDYFISENHVYSGRYSEWVIKQKVKIENSELSEIERKEFLACLPSLEVVSDTESERLTGEMKGIELDSNRMYYICSTFLTKFRRDYQTYVDYKSYYKTLLERKSDEINKSITDIAELNKEARAALFMEVINNWYLFDSEFTSQSGIEYNSGFLSGLLVQYGDEPLPLDSLEPIAVFGIDYSSGFTTGGEMVSHKSFYIANGNRKIYYNVEGYIKPTFNLALFGRLLLRANKTFFAFLSLKASATVGKLSDSDIKDEYFLDYRGAYLGGYKHFKDYAELNSSVFYAGYLKAFAPAYYIFTSLYLFTGFEVGYEYAELKYDIVQTETLETPSHIYPTKYQITNHKIVNRKVNLRFNAGLNYDLFTNLHFFMEYATPGQLYLGAGVGIR